MSDWAAKRFWKLASVAATDDGYTVTLDGRSVKTPAKSPLVVPTKPMAAAIAAEWDAQDKKINPETMPVTRAANSAIDKVAVQRAEVVAMLAEYGGSDLLCYRAAEPEALVALQTNGWDPVLDWVAKTHDARLVTAVGVMHVDQPANALQNLFRAVDKLDSFALAGFHDLVALSGSLVLASAVIEEHLTPQDAWQLSRIDEEFQISQWGDDEEARELSEIKRESFEAAFRFYKLSLT